MNVLVFNDNERTIIAADRIEAIYQMDCVPVVSNKTTYKIEVSTAYNTYTLTYADKLYRDREITNLRKTLNQLNNPPVE